MTSSRLHKIFKELGLIEIYKAITDKKPLVSFFKGRKQLDTTWVSPNLYSKATGITLFFFSICNHQLIILRFNVDLILG